MGKKGLLAACMWTEKTHYWQCWCGQKKKKKKYTGYVGVDRKDLMLRGCGQRRSTGCVGVEKRYTGYVGVDKKKSTDCLGVDKRGLLAVWAWTERVYCLYGRGPEQIN